MTKKRQQDFAKVHLKPGRPLKKSNLTSVKFKSRKIVMPKERVVKRKSELTIADCTRKLKNAGSEKDRFLHLNELNKLIHRQSDSLHTELTKIFEPVLNILRDPHDDVRNLALKITLYVLENTEDSHLRYYARLLNGTINAVFKSPSPKISSSSLILLDGMVKNHPDLICHNLSILPDLLPLEKVHYTRQNAGEKGTFLYSETEEINNLGHINFFLKSMLEHESDLTKHQDDNDVYMDENQTMSLVLYTSSGLKPIDIEEVYSKQFNPKVVSSEQAETLTVLLNRLIRAIPVIFSRIIRSRSNTDDNALNSESIADLSIIAQVLCCMVEISERISQTVAAEEIATIIKEKVYSPYRKRFPFELLTIQTGTSVEPLAMLNASLCFLFMKFLFSNESRDSDWQIIQRYFKKFFAHEKIYSSEIKCKCIPLFIKMIQLFSYKESAPDAIFFLLKELVYLLVKTRINHPNKKKLINFLYNMSITSEYEFWFESEPMMMWFGWLLSHLKENMHKLDRKLRKMICKISKLGHPSFMKNLNFSVLKPLLKHRNDDFKETAIILLTNMDIDNKTFKNVYDIISLESYPRKFAVTLIRMLNVKFHQSSMSEKNYIDYIEFLLNTAIGVYNISSSRFLDLEDNKYTKAVQLIQHGHPYAIVPSLYWKEHSKLFEVCQTCLRNLPEAPISLLFTRLVKEVMNGRLVVPIHCVLAILKLDKIMPEITDKLYRHLKRNLNFSCLMTTSVLTQTSMDDEWFKWNISELMNSMPLTEESALQILELLHHGEFSKDSPDGLVVYFILRVLRMFLAKGLFREPAADDFLRVLSSLAEDCSDQTLRYQPLYIELSDYFEQGYEDDE